MFRGKHVNLNSYVNEDVAAHAPISEDGIVLKMEAASEDASAAGSTRRTLRTRTSNSSAGTGTVTVNFYAAIFSQV